MSSTAAVASNDTFWVWLAGFWEGEGSIGNNAEGTSMYIGLSQAGERGEKIIRKIWEVTGVGKIRLQTKRRPSYQDQWEWRVFKFGDIEDLMARLLPHMYFRQDEVLAFLRRIGERRRGREWSPGELAILQKHYLLSDRELSQLLSNRSWSTIRWKREQLGLLKSPGQKPLRSLLQSKLNTQPTGSF